MLYNPTSSIPLSALPLGPANTVLWSDGITNQWSGDPIVSTMRVGDGTIGAPSYTFASDPTFGFFNLISLPSIGELQLAHSTFPVLVLGPNVTNASGLGASDIILITGSGAPALNYQIFAIGSANAFADPGPNSLAGVSSVGLKVIGAVSMNIGTADAAPVTFYTGGIAAANRRLQITPTGNILIGSMTEPSTGTMGLVFGDGTALASLAADTAGLYANDVAGTVNIFGINEAGESTRLTWPAPQTYTPSNVTTDRSYDANLYTMDELADVLGTLISDLQARGVLA